MRDKREKEERERERERESKPLSMVHCRVSTIFISVDGSSSSDRYDDANCYDDGDGKNSHGDDDGGIWFFLLPLSCGI